MKRLFTYLKGRKAFGVVFLIGFLLFCFSFQSGSFADDSVQRAKGIQIEVMNTPLGNEPYDMRTKQLVLKLNANNSVSLDDNAYKISWIISSTEQQKIVSVQSSASNKLEGVVTALKPGTATVTAVVTYTDSVSGTSKEIESISCQIKVVFSILESESNGFKQVIPDSERKALVLNVGDIKQMELNYGKAQDKNCTWYSDNEDVVTITSSTESNLNGGKLTAVGAGKTTIHASYLPDNETTPIIDDIDVYVVPKFSEDNVSFVSSGIIKTHTGERVYLDTNYDKNGGGIKDKVTWVIEKTINGKSEVIADSIGKNSDLISLDVTSDNRKSLAVKAKAGDYSIKFFPTGIYEANSKTPLKDMNQSFFSSMTLKVYGEFGDKDATLNIGDSYNVADAFNLTVEDFNSMFYSAVTATDANIFSYIPSSCYGTAVNKGDATITITVGNSTAAQGLCDGQINPNGYKVKLKVIDGLSLDRTSVTIALGAELQLTESHSTTGGIFKWESSDSNYVSVTQNGLIKGIKVTDDNKDIRVSVTQTLPNGNIKRATCMVKVVNTVTDIKLNYKEVDVEVDKTITILATFNPNVSNAPIRWLSSNEDVVTMSVSNDNKSVVLTGKKAGSTIITAVNKDNFVTASCRVTVLAPIKTISLDNTTINVKLNREVVKLKASYTPTDATSKELVWTSSNKSVATVDSDGLVKLVSAGTTVITVHPKYNPYLVMAQCVVNVIQSATGLNLTTSEVTVEVGDTKEIGYTLTPVNATTTITWKSMDTTVATVDSSGKVKGVNAGRTYIIATTESGLVSTCSVIVTKVATGITLDVYHLTLAVGDTYQVIANPNPANSSEKTFSWTSKDSSIATVNSSGKVTGVKAGETIILVKTKQGKVEYLYVTVYDNVKSMKLNYSKKTIVKGKKFTLKPIFTPSKPTNSKVKWKSADTKIATVSSKGVVTGVRGGTTVITGVSVDGGHIATCVVKVTQPVTSITLNKSSYSLGVGKTVTLKATVKSNYSTKQKIKWTSSNVRVAKVSSKGVVTGVKLGTVTIKASATDGSGEYAVCKIRVVRQATKITLNKTTMKMLVGDTTRLRATVSPRNATFKNVSWKTSDSSVANIDENGNITAIKVGSCKITASAKDNSRKQAVCWVYVSKAVPSTGVTVSNKDLVIVKGRSEALPFSISPSNTTDKVRFYSDNKGVASVSSTGRVTARRPGVATITIRTSSGRNAMISVTVVDLNRKSITLGQYEREELWVEEISSGVKWYSENAKIATVENGSVVSRMKGTTRIVASVKGVKLYCTVKVK